MRLRRFLSFLLAFLVMLATFPSNMAFAFGASDASGTPAMAGCHESMTANMDSAAHDTTTHEQHGHDAPVGAQAQHGCCAGFVGIVSLTELFLPMESAREITAFRPSLRLAASMASIYRPPRNA
jgi:hypothetical protein